jgi:hypothetical protein
VGQADPILGPREQKHIPATLMVPLVRKALQILFRNVPQRSLAE